MIQNVVRIENELGLHARAAARLVKLASRFRARVWVSRLDTRQQIDGKSILGILLLAASRGTLIQITVDGEDEKAAMEAIVQLVQNRFGEEK